MESLSGTGPLTEPLPAGQSPVNNMEKPWLPYLLAFLWVGLIVAFLPRAFAENDDVGIAFLLRENFHAPFISPLLSQWLMFAYNGLSRNIAWYGILHYALLAFALGNVLTLVLRQQAPFWLRGVLAVLAALPFVHFVSQLTFTYTATLLLWSSLLAWLAHLQERLAGGGSVKSLLWVLLGCGVLFTAAYTSRNDALKTLLFAMPPLAYLGWRYRTAWRQCLLSAAVFLAPMVALQLIQPMLVRIPPATQTYFQYIGSMGGVLGYGYNRLYDYPDYQQRVGFDHDDYAMMRDWLYLDETYFSREKMDQILSFSSPMLVRTTQKLLTTPMVFGKLPGYLKKVWWEQREASFFFLGMMLLCLLAAGGSRQRLYPVAYGLFLFGGALLMMLYLRFPSRLGLPVFYGAAVSFFILPGFSLAAVLEHLRSRAWLPKLMLLAFVALLSVAIGTTVYQTGKMPRKIAAYAKDHQYLSDLTESAFLIRTVNTAFVKWLDPLSAELLPRSDFGPGWLVFSPPFYQRLNAFGLTRASDILPWMTTSPNAYLLMKPSHMPVLRRYYKKRYHRELAPQVVGHLPKHSESVVYRLTVR